MSASSSAAPSAALELQAGPFRKDRVAACGEIAGLVKK
jgi:hypothetical protein